jgi:RNA polymerase sigma factor (sigma-70 family)
MTAIEFNHQLIALENKLSRFALSLTYNSDDAKDLVQDTMLKALIYREQFVNPTNLKAWSYTIMKNTFINNYRKNIRYNTTFDKDTSLLFLSNTKEGQYMTDSVCISKELRHAVEGLDDCFKIPFKMLTEGYKYKEIAQMLGIKIGTVKSRIFITRKKLMDVLADYDYTRMEDEKTGKHVTAPAF